MPGQARSLPGFCSAREKKLYQVVNLGCSRAETLLRRFKEKTKNHRVALLRKEPGAGELETVASLAADGELKIQYRDLVMEKAQGGLILSSGILSELLTDGLKSQLFDR